MASTLPLRGSGEMIDVLFLAVQVLYLFAPLLFSAAASALVLRFDLIAWAARPIDGGATLAGRRLLGDGKTWRGVLVAVLGCATFAWIQAALVGERAGRLALVDYDHLSPLAFGGAMGLGAMLGELPNSFLKRRLGIDRGGTARATIPRAVFWTYDQIDLLTMAWPAIAPWLRPEPRLVVTSVALALLVHPLVSLVGFLVGARRSAR